MVFLCESERIAYAEKLLALDPDPIPRFVIYRDLLRMPSDQREYVVARDAVWAHPHVKTIAEAQDPRGIWEPFHGTTEAMIRRLLSYGLDRTHPTLAAAEPTPMIPMIPIPAEAMMRAARSRIAIIPAVSEASSAATELIRR